ncbi:unnamed protein product [Thelazia callipaeda]|uniref:MARVEL domain-containing protein n=1 Tax=Thelazia callipaeda TaxID=103827 RepID=A0A0N5D0Y5_THECL|nr:unnamed protein product [Thelazia callipaeda]
MSEEDLLATFTWLHFIVALHVSLAISLCIFTVIGYVVSITPMALIVLFIFQVFIAFLGLTAISQNRQDFQSLYVFINAVTAGSAIIWSIFILLSSSHYSHYLLILLLLIALYSILTTTILVFWAHKKVPQPLHKLITLNVVSVFSVIKLPQGDNDVKLETNNLHNKFHKSKSLVKMKEVDSNETLHGNCKS